MFSDHLAGKCLFVAVLIFIRYPNDYIVVKHWVVEIKEGIAEK